MLFLTPGCLTRSHSLSGPGARLAQLLSPMLIQYVSHFQPRTWFVTGFQRPGVGGLRFSHPLLSLSQTLLLKQGSQHSEAFSPGSCLGFAIPSLIKARSFGIARWLRVQALLSAQRLSIRWLNLAKLPFCHTKCSWVPGVLRVILKWCTKYLNYRCLQKAQSRPATFSLLFHLLLLDFFFYLKNFFNWRNDF